MSTAATQKPVISRGIACPRLKSGIYVLEAFNALATTYAFYYIYFFAEKKYGFGALQNFLLAAGLGATYMVSAVYGGKFAQKKGYFCSFRTGVVVMIAGLFGASQVDLLWPKLGLVFASQAGMCFTWPALQALLSEGEPPVRLQGLLGWYNCTWAVAGAFAYFSGGAMIDALGFESIFYVPVTLLMIELGFAIWLERKIKARPEGAKWDSAPPSASKAEFRKASVPPETFLKMAWLANPFAYLAINTIIAAGPTLAKNLGLGQAAAGYVCSIWMFVRAGSFVFLRFWPNWHYRFRFLAGSYIAMVLCFALMLLVPNLTLLVVAQVVFGAVMGLIYYSSIFYSMDVGETKGEHGGIHEAAIGAGCFGGPAIAGGALYYLPAQPHSGAWAVSLLLFCGMAGLFRLRYRKHVPPTPPAPARVEV